MQLEYRVRTSYYHNYMRLLLRTTAPFAATTALRLGSVEAGTCHFCEDAHKVLHLDDVCRRRVLLYHHRDILARSLGCVSPADV